MPTTLTDQQYSDLLARLANAAAAPEAIQAKANQAMDQQTGAWNTRLATMAVDVFVDAINGNDANPGTLAAPMKNLALAVGKGVPFGRVSIHLLSDYTNNQIPYVVDRFVRIKSSGVRRKFSHHVTAGQNGGYSLVSPVMLRGVASLTFDDVEYVVPSSAGFANPFNWGLIKPAEAEQLDATPHVIFQNCSIRIPATRISSIIDQANTLWHFRMRHCLFPEQGPLGHLFTSHENTAGSSTFDMHWLNTDQQNI